VLGYLGDFLNGILKFGAGDGRLPSFALVPGKWRYVTQDTIPKTVDTVLEISGSWYGGSTWLLSETTTGEITIDLIDHTTSAITIE